MGRRSKPHALQPLEAGALPPLALDLLTRLDGDDALIALGAQIRRAPLGWRGGAEVLASPREKDLGVNLLPALVSGSSHALAPSRRPLEPLEDLVRGLPTLDFEAALVGHASRSVAVFGCRRRAVPAGAGSRLTPLQAPTHAVLALESPLAMPDLRPFCPGDIPTASVHRGRERVAPLVPALAVMPSDGTPTASNESGLETGSSHLNHTMSRTPSLSARAAEVSAVHDTFIEECSRGNSTTAATAEAIRRCRSNVCRDSMYDSERSSETATCSMASEATSFDDSRRLLLSEGEDAMGVTA